MKELSVEEKLNNLGQKYCNLFTTYKGLREELFAICNKALEMQREECSKVVTLDNTPPFRNIKPLNDYQIQTILNAPQPKFTE